MANWKDKLDISLTFQAVGEGHLTVKQGCDEVIEKIKALKIYPEYKEDLDCMIQNFKDAGDLDNEDDFDAALEDLYDFGDREHRLWIEIRDA